MFSAGGACSPRANLAKPRRMITRSFLPLALLVTLAAACSSSEGGTGGSGGAKGCPVCADLDEQACTAKRTPDEQGCEPVSGVQLGSSGATQYAGCANWCRNEGVVLAETCGRSPVTGSPCFTFKDGLLPEGWILLSDTKACADLPECTAAP